MVRREPSGEVPGYMHAPSVYTLASSSKKAASKSVPSMPLAMREPSVFARQDVTQSAALVKALSASQQLSEQLHIATSGVLDLDKHLAAELRENRLLKQQLASETRTKEEATIDLHAALKSKDAELVSASEQLASTRKELNSTQRELNSTQNQLSWTQRDLQGKLNSTSAELAGEKSVLNETATQTGALRTQLANATAKMAEMTEEDDKEIIHARADVTQAVAIEKRFAAEERALLKQRKDGKILAKEVKRLKTSLRKAKVKMAGMRAEEASRVEALDNRIGTLEKRDDELTVAATSDKMHTLFDADKSDALSPKDLEDEHEASVQHADESVAETEKQVLESLKNSKEAEEKSANVDMAAEKAAKLSGEQTPSDSKRQPSQDHEHGAYDALKQDQAELRRENLRIRRRLRNEADI